MPTARTVTVKSSGGDYTSLASAEAGEQGNLVTLDRQLNIECYASAAGDSTIVDINGWTCDSTRYIDIYCPVGERHAGVWDAAKYHLSVTTSGSPGGVLRNQESSTKIRYLQIRNLRASPPVFNSDIYVDDTTFVDGCICRDGWMGVQFNLIGCEMRNTICYGCADAGAYITGTAGGRSVAYNCTLIGVYGIKSDASTNFPFAKNCYVHGSTRGFATNGGAANSLITKTNCMSSDTTATENGGGGGATNCTNSVGHNTTNFTNVTAGSESYLLPSGSGLIDHGVDLSATFTNDVNGTTRPQSSVFDIGADEYLPVVSGKAPYNFQHITRFYNRTRLI